MSRPSPIVASGSDSWGTKFVVISRETHPGDPMRWRLLVVESTPRRVNAAINNLMLRPNQGH
jgi:hypothetical protein